MAHDSTYALKDEKSTLALGAALARCLHSGLSVYLHGDLGAGKTTLVRGLLRACGYSGKVKSPTYTLVEPYTIMINNMNINIYHFDLYRFADENEWEFSGFRDYFNAQSICIVEWPEKAQGVLPMADIELSLLHSAEDTMAEAEHAVEQRIAQLKANSESGRLCLQALEVGMPSMQAEGINPLTELHSKSAIERN